MRVTVVGSGDAFGSGGRLMTCFLVDTAAGPVMLDCGPTATIGLDRVGRDPNSIETVIISHLHGDHFAGLVWMYIHALYAGDRRTPLAVYGPPGIEARFIAAAEILYPACTKVELKFALSFHEIHAGVPAKAGPVDVLAFEVEHPSGAPSYALRLSAGGKVLAFSGDTRWVEALVPCGQGADLYIMECYTFEKPSFYHLGWVEIAANLDRLAAKRVLLTHMSKGMQARRHEIRDPRVLIAEDGQIIDV